MKILFLILILFFICSCNQTGAQNAVQNAAATKTSPTPTGTPTEEETKKRQADAEAEKLKAVNDFIAAKYPKWKLKGIEDTEAYPFIDLQLEKGKETKVIRVTYREFTGVDGSPYKVVTEVAKSDLVKERDEKIRNEWKTDALASILDLSDSDQSDIKDYYRDVIAEEDSESRDDDNYEPPEMY